MTLPRTAPEDLARERAVPLEMDADAFRRAGHLLVDRLAELLASVPSRPVTPGESPAAVRAAFGLGGPLPEHGMAADALLEDTAQRLFDHSLFNGHPRFFGYITSSPAPIGILGDLLASALNPNVGAWTLSPAATEIAREPRHWIAGLIGYPTDTGRVPASGGHRADLGRFVDAAAALTRANV